MTYCVELILSSQVPSPLCLRLEPCVGRDGRGEEASCATYPLLVVSDLLPLLPLPLHK